MRWLAGILLLCAVLGYFLVPPRRYRSPLEAALLTGQVDTVTHETWRDKTEGGTLSIQGETMMSTGHSSGRVDGAAMGATATRSDYRAFLLELAKFSVQFRETNDDGRPRPPSDIVDITVGGKTYRAFLDPKKPSRLRNVIENYWNHAVARSYPH